MPRRRITIMLASAALALGVSACGQEPVAEIEEIPVGTTYVTLDRGFVDALNNLGLTPGPVGSAAIKNGSARFPMTGGNVTIYKPGTEDPYVQGEIRHGGSGLGLERGQTRVALTDFVVDPGESVLTGNVWVDGDKAVEGEKLFLLDGRTLQPVRTIDSGAVLEGTTVRLTEEAASLLNDTFGTDALEQGLEIGVAKLVVRTQPLPD